MKRAPINEWEWSQHHINITCRWYLLQGYSVQKTESREDIDPIIQYHLSFSIQYQVWRQYVHSRIFDWLVPRSHIICIGHFLGKQNSGRRTNGQERRNWGRERKLRLGFRYSFGGQKSIRRVARTSSFPHWRMSLRWNERRIMTGAHTWGTSLYFYQDIAMLLGRGKADALSNVIGLDTLRVVGEDLLSDLCASQIVIGSHFVIIVGILQVIHNECHIYTMFKMSYSDNQS